MKPISILDQLQKSKKLNYRLVLVAAGVGLTGLVTISSVLLAVLRAKHIAVVSADAGATILIGLSFIYLASLLRRGKRTAWLVAIGLYIFLLARNLRHFSFDLSDNEYPLSFALLNIVLPVLVLAGLVLARRHFNVKSEVRSFTTALRRSVLVLAVAFLYGIVGFQLLDDRDFHQDIPLLSGAHYTIDQFGLTTNHLLVAHTKRAKLFLDSLGTISLGSLFYVGVSLFAPIRFKLTYSARDDEDMARLLRKYPSTSEDFFKLWPPDKAYFFSPNRDSALAYRTVRGVALVVGDPIGRPAKYKNLVAGFGEYCRVNDWEPAFIHTETKNSNLYRALGFDSQKIGQEAVVNTEHFVKSVAVNKYFHHISGKFERLGYSVQFLQPPHNQKLIARLKEISDGWLSESGRSERSFMMGYFNFEYLQQCRLVVAMDKDLVIQGFMNQLPSFSHKEASFDFIRHSQDTPGNINDFLMLSFIARLRSEGYDLLNMGLAPLAGLETISKDKTATNTLLSIVYGSGNRFFSFRGLKNFKAKYEPRWEDRFIIYHGGLPGFSKVLNALLLAMRPPRRKNNG